MSTPYRTAAMLAAACVIILPTAACAGKKTKTDTAYIARDVNTLYGLAKERLRRSEAAVRTTLADLGRNLEGPWRAEHKLAALAAWLVLFK